MAKNDALFEESSQGAVSAVTAFVFIISMVLAFGGLVAMTYAFDPALSGGASFAIFTGSLLVSIVGWILPFTLLPAIGK